MPGLLNLLGILHIKWISGTEVGKSLSMAILYGMVPWECDVLTPLSKFKSYKTLSCFSSNPFDSYDAKVGPVL